jgi:sulfite reductase (ferredoxin)
MAVPLHAEGLSTTSIGNDASSRSGPRLGECAGEVVSLFGIEVVKAEAQAFDAQIALDEGDPEAAEEIAYAAMLSAARALVRTEYIDVTQQPDDIVAEWKKRFFDTERFFDRFAKGTFGRYLLDRHANGPEKVTAEMAAQRVEEAQLFIEAAGLRGARGGGARRRSRASDGADLAPAEA